MSDSEDADYIFMVEDKLRELTAERDALRDALEKIRLHASGDCYKHGCKSVVENHDILALAKAALGEKPE
jgi:hypothetical protein